MLFAALYMCHYMITYPYTYKMYMRFQALGMNTDIYMNKQSSKYEKVVVIMQVAFSISF